MDTPIIPTDLISPNQAASLLATHGNTVRRWCHDGTLPAFRVGGRLRVSRADVLALIRRVEAPGPTIPTRAEIAARDAETDRVLRECGVRK